MAVVIVTKMKHMWETNKDAAWVCIDSTYKVKKVQISLVLKEPKWRGDEKALLGHKYDENGSDNASLKFSTVDDLLEKY